MVGEAGIVAAAVLGVQTQHDVEHARFFRRELAIGAKHRQDGLGRRLTRDKAMHDHGAIVVARLLGVIGKDHHARHARHEGNCRVDLMLGRAVLRVGIVGIQKKNRTGKHVHDVRRGVFQDHRCGEAIGQLALRIDRGDEGVELVSRGQLAEKEQVGYLFEAETSRGALLTEQVGDLVAAQAQRALVRQLVAIGEQIAVHVRDVRHTRENAGAVGIAQASLHAELLVIGWVDAIDSLELLIEIDTLVVHARHLSFSFHHDNALQRSTAHRSRDSVNLRENVTWAR